MTMKNSWYVKTRPLFNVILFSLPIILTGFLTLLAFYPGIMTTDSGSDIRDAVLHTNTSEGPPLYRWVIYGLVTIFHKPAVIGLFQIACLAFSFGWGLSLLNRRGLPWGICLAISSLFGIFPINLIYPITVWDDILYCTALLILTIIAYQIIASEFEWLNQPFRWLGPGLTLLAASLLRSIGLPVSTGYVVPSFILITAVKNIGLKKFFYSIGFFLLGYLLVILVIYPMIRFQENRPYRYLYIHHLAAHVANKTPLVDSKRQSLNTLYPLDQWKYNCYSQSTTIYIDRSNLDLFQKEE